jgi:hypothetical protein
VEDEIIDFLNEHKDSLREMSLRMAIKIADLRKIGEEKYKMPDGTFTTYIAYEIHKRDMYRFMKKQIRLNSKLNDAERKTIEEMVDQELKKAEALGD